MADKWTLEEVLGQGGMAVVYAATHRNGHRTAIKMLLPHIARDESLVRRFLREGYLANKVPHDGAVRVLDDGRAADGSPFLVMERLDGYTLDAHLEKGKPPLDVRDALDLMLELLAILEAAHGVGMVHRDIKPANIFRTTQGQLKLLDFGIALLVEAGPSANATMSGAVIGTPAYMAPEQARGRKELVGPRSDLWAVAASGLSLMLGRRLRNGTTAAEELAMAALQPLAPASTFGPALRGAFGDALDRALAFEPHERFATAAEMRAALLECREQTAHVALAGPTGSARSLPIADTITVREPSTNAALSAPVVEQAVAVTGASSSRGWIIPVLFASVAASAIGVAIVKRQSDDAASIAPTTLSTTAAVPSPPAAAVPPIAEAGAQPAASETAPPPPGPSHRPRSAPSPARPAAKPAATRDAPAKPATAKPDFMDER